jgi:hypothetical protein
MSAKKVVTVTKKPTIPASNKVDDVKIHTSELGIAQIAYGIVTKHKLNKTSLFRDIWEAVRTDLTPQVITQVKGGYNINQLNGIIQLCYYYIKKL